MKVLLTGGAGYIGIITTAHLLRQGFEVVVFDKCLFGAAPLLSLFSPQFRFIRGDIRNRDSLHLAMQGCQAVVHMAALVGEQACLLDPEATKTINFQGAEIAFSLAQENNIERFIFISTCSNYGVSSPDTLADEESSLNPLTEYARTKILAEQMILNSNASLAATIFRFGTICGLSPQMRFDLLVNDIARAAALGRSVQIFAPKAWRPFLHIKDAARAIEHTLNAPVERVRNKIFNVISENYQKAALVDLVHKHFPQIPIAVVDKNIDPRDYRVSAERIKREIDFSPLHTVELAFLEIAHAVKDGIFLNPWAVGYSAVPEHTESLCLN